MSVRLLIGDCRDVLAALPDESVHCIVTSPPYFGLRDYGVDGQIGLEASPVEYVEQMVAVFSEARRVLRDDGTLWLNLGDSYAASRGSQGRQGHSEMKSRAAVSARHIAASAKMASGTGSPKGMPGLKQKNLIGIPWRVAFALQDDGWYLRQDIIWCLSGGAWVYARTQKGDMPVMVKDLVRLDPATVKLWNGEKWTRVIGWGPSNDTSQRMEIVLRSGERIGCTGGHLWPTQRGNVAARDLKLGDTIQTCRLPEPESAKRPAYLTDGLLWLIGLYLAEGSRSGDTIQLSLHGDEKPWVPLIDMAAEQVGATITYHDEGNALHVRLYGKVLNAVMDEYIGGRTAIDKHLTAKAWALPSEALRMIAQGYLHGDGHDDGIRVRLGFCRNYALERDLRTLAARLGATLTLKPCEATYQGGKKPAFRGEWRWERSGHHNDKDRGEIIDIRAGRARKFWDIAVEDEPHLFALASGVLTHNCKPNPMPESVLDRCTKAHEYLFLLSKSARYHFDHEAIRETASGSLAGNVRPGKGAQAYLDGDEKHRTKAGLLDLAKRQRSRADSFKREGSKREQAIPGQSVGTHRPDRAESTYDVGTRNKRSVWTVATQPFNHAHFATFPPALIEPCILAGCPAGGTVLDPFGGAGTTGLVADRLQREAVLIELNPAYAEMARRRIHGDSPLFTEVTA